LKKRADRERVVPRSFYALIVMAVFLVTAAVTTSLAHAATVTLSTPKMVKVDGELPARVHSGLTSPFRVALQQERGGRWHTVARRTVRKGSGTELTWRVRSPLPFLTIRAVVRSRHGTGHSARRHVRIKRRTQALRANRIVAAPQPGEAGRLRYKGTVPLRPGDIVAASSGPTTPDGFLGLVTSVSASGGNTEVQTVPTTLLAAVPSGSINVDSSSTPTARASSTPQPVSRAIKCTGGAEVKVEGSVSVAPTVSLRAKWSLFHGVTSARFEAGLKLDGDLEASAQAAASCKATPVTLARWDLPVIDVQVGPVPVVLLPVVKIVLEGNGSVSAQVSTGLHGSVTASGGLSYSHGSVSPIGKVSHTFTYDAPAPTAEAHLEGDVGPTVSLLLYGVAGPEVDLRTGLALDAETAADPWWRLTAPIKVDADLAVPVLGLHTGKKTVFHQSVPLAQASGPFAPPSTPSPAPRPAPGIVFVGAPGTGSPPATLGPYTMQPFASDPQALEEEVTGVDGPTGTLAFSVPLVHLLVGEEPAWATWSNGYSGDVYASESEPTVTLVPPAGTRAFYLYAEPDAFEVFDVTVHTQDGTTSGSVPVFGEAGAAFFGFYTEGGATIESITVESPEDEFAVGEFGIAAG